MADDQQIRVKPATASGARLDKVYLLSDLDHLMPKLYVHMIEIFELPAQTDKTQVVNNLVEGLARTLADYPLLAGTLHFDNDARRIVVRVKPDSTVALHVKEAPSSEIPAFAVLDQYDFPVHILDSPKVLPPLFVAEHWNPIPSYDVSVDGPAVAGAQVTFIEGGLILGLAIPHQVCDAMGFERLLTTWAQYAASFAKGGDLNGLSAATDEVSPRSILSASGKWTHSAEEIMQYESQFPVMKLRDGPPAAPPVDFKMPVVKTRIWHFPRSKLNALKAKCSAGQEPGNWISTYDALLSIMWRATVRAKSPLVKPAPDAPSKAVHAVNARGRAEPAIPARYIGACITMPQSENLTVRAVLGDLDSTLPVLARAVRASINSVTPAYVAHLIKYAAGAQDLRWSELDMHWILSLDCMAFDWHTMNSYKAHDFGFGKPAAVRWPHPGFEGFFFVLPSRAGVRNAGPDEGLEVCFGIEESCFAQLEKDEEFLQYAEQRGVGI
ncbi:trichothecene 3-o-acetyltransferase [Microdochium bolleyi]|uniref:Trichothecene 3-o-acetyltransferase n=1 Tax=Microdochium bolleyi TaxID=196109 RepID=A0A136IU59_9PEZI|nr:trichothecene 3-o-acetyltransferase [Microdochium bolleyi]